MAEVLTNMFASFSVTDVIDVAIVTFVVYKVMTFIRETRAEQLVKGLLILVAATFLSDVLNLYTLNWLLEGTLTLGVIALIIVFQPELRRGLEYIGRSKFIRKQFGEMNKEKAKTITSTIIKAIDYFSVNKIGALLIIERETTLNDIIETGTEMDASVPCWQRLSLHLFQKVYSFKFSCSVSRIVMRISGGSTVILCKGTREDTIIGTVWLPVFNPSISMYSSS
jgi:diadenylate cyclase